MTPLSRYAQITTVVTHLTLAVGLLLWTETLAGQLLVVPLLFPLPGLLRGRDYTYAWFSLMLSFYCAGLLAEGVARPELKLVSFALAGVSAIEFAALNLYVRLRARERQASAAQKAASGAASP